VSVKLRNLAVLDAFTTPVGKLEVVINFFGLRRNRTTSVPLRNGYC